MNYEKKEQKSTLERNQDHKFFHCHVTWQEHQVSKTERAKKEAERDRVNRLHLGKVSKSERPGE